ncbi:MAG: TonB-dependent receptor [Candidatus Binatia bacterium]
MHRHRSEFDIQRIAQRARGPLAYAIAVGLLALGTQTAIAADSEARGAATLEEVVVTARYTNESVQNTPLSIVSLTSERLEKEGITTLLDTAQTTSGVTFVSGGGPYLKSLGAMIRGVGQRDFIPALQPGIGVYVDDVYLGSIVGSSAELGDVDRVEILKGPQGTLFGRNNEGGAVRVFNKKPMGDNSGVVELGFGDYDQRRVKASVDVHLNDQLFARLTASTRKARGHVEQIDFACARPSEAGNIRPIAMNGNCLMGYAGSEDVNYYRAAFRWLPSSSLEINVMGDSMTNYGTPPADRTAYISPSGILQLANENVNIPTYGIPVDNRFISPNFYEV